MPHNKTHWTKSVIYTYKKKMSDLIYIPSEINVCNDL